MIQIILIIAFIALVVALVLSIEFPELAPQIVSALDAIIYYFGQGMDIVWLFVPKTVTLALLTLAVSIEFIVLGYRFIMWILRKIPTAGID